MNKKLWPLACLLALVACSTQEQSQVSDAVATPLSELNLVRKNIPEVLRAAVRQPYAAAPAECEQIWQDVLQLDAVLGPDLDKPADNDNPGLVERGTDLAKGSVIKAIGRTTEGVVPFRSWVRKLTGAERHDHQVAAAIAAGGIRRAFLKGIWVARDCH